MTFGSSIPLFTLGLDEIKAIGFPGALMTPGQRAPARWLNFFDRDDVLGYPLKPTGPAYGAAVNEDLEINVGGWFKSRTPLSHNGYWESKDLARRLAGVIGSLAGA